MNKELMAELVAQFRTNTAERLVTMRVLVERLEANPSDADALRELHRHFHGLAGLGGTYGFQRISDLASDAEELCESVAAGKPLEEEILGRFRTIAHEIAHEIEPA